MPRDKWGEKVKSPAAALFNVIPEGVELDRWHPRAPFQNASLLIPSTKFAAGLLNCGILEDMKRRVSRIEDYVLFPMFPNSSSISDPYQILGTKSLAALGI